jgi:hypothetical protein
MNTNERKLAAPDQTQLRMMQKIAGSADWQSAVSPIGNRQGQAAIRKST